MTKTAVAYARFSSDKQRSESVDAQVRAIKEYCKNRKIRLLKVYADSAISGTVDNRPEFQKMIKEVTHTPCDYVVVHKLDRFARNRYDSAINERKLNQCGIQVLSVLENFDDSPEAVILKSVIVGMNEYYSLNLARETMKGLKENALNAKHTGGTPPLGYDVDENKNYILNPIEAEAVKIIFNMYLHGHGYGEIINYLNDHGFKTKRGTEFGKNSIYDILGNEKYTGTLVWNRTYQGINNRFNRHKYKDDDEIIRVKGALPVIIKKEDFEKVRVMREKNKRKSGTYKSKRIYLLSGLIECECGAMMVGNVRTGGTNHDRDYYYYTCNAKDRKKTCNYPSINADKIENLILDFFQEVLFTPQNIELLVQGIHTYLTMTGSESVDDMKKQKQKIDAEIANCVEFIKQGSASLTIAKTLDDLEKQSRYLDAAIKKAYFDEENAINEQEIYDYILSHKDIRTFSRSEQKLILANFIEKIKISEDGYHVTLRAISTSSDILDIHGGEGGIRTHVPRRTN